jgi:hypothetical protein
MKEESAKPAASALALSAFTLTVVLPYDDSRVETGTCSVTAINTNE